MDNEQEVEAKRVEIVGRMKVLRKQLEAGNTTDVLAWIIPDELACAQRPLRHHPRYGGSGSPIPREATPLVVEWAEQVKLEGVASIIDFMHDRDLRCYESLDLPGGNFRAFLQDRGFAVVPLPWEDPAHSRTDPVQKRARLEEMRKLALRAYDDLPKPVLLICSAAIDRSAPAAAFIWKHREKIPPNPKENSDAKGLE